MESKTVPSLLEVGGEAEPPDIERLDNDDVEYEDVEEQLEKFRRQWKEELTGHQSGQTVSEKVADDDEKEAAALFLMGSKLEQEGALYEAVSFYRRAMQLVPDIEMRVNFPMKSPRERQESESSVDSFDVEDREADLVMKFHHMQLEEKRLCYPEYQQRATHISALPVEVLIYIFKWVISSQLDMRSLESISMVCRGFYICARDEEFWKLACQRLWGSNIGKVKKYGTYRTMYLERPHLQYVGCYISKMSYIRQGENSVDGFYSPWHQIEYYRYIRFFSEGQVLMMTSPEDPYMSLPLMKSFDTRSAGMMKGLYKLSGNRVTAVLKRVQVQETTNNRYKRNYRNQKNNSDMQQTFHIELEIQSSGKRNGHKLTWVTYSVRTCYRTTSEETESSFELTNQAYPPLLFSRVKSFATSSNSPILS
ncbi:F-box only protein 9-like [Dreissena polymorpha]|uniref:F-box only protein 9 n=1 Tax=Dreissena polymorpha TaxID=45954 RepID=A0A9D3Z0C8_DREPO|nr:F-box only protein 9-like [Dreissena polymorpha]KAH3709582.1 hypothetical protein DPMN_069046 [Dreissena polymorpha]